MMPSSSRTLRVAPSILSANFGELSAEVRKVIGAGADWVHVDVMDGRFVPNLTVGPLVVSAVRKATDRPVDTHLMIVEPERYLKAFANAGSDIITVHAEACTHLHRTVQQIRALGKKAGVALNPHTDASVVRYVLSEIDLILVMTVNPGFGGQSFISSMLKKIEELHAMIDTSGYAIDLEVDGGINVATTAQVLAAGANVLVAGSAVFGTQDYERAIATLKGTHQ